MCGSFLVVGDAPQRVEDHQTGKQHVGYAKCRDMIDTLRVCPAKDDFIKALLTLYFAFDASMIGTFRFATHFHNYEQCSVIRTRMVLGERIVHFKMLQ